MFNKYSNGKVKNRLIIPDSVFEQTYKIFTIYYIRNTGQVEKLS